eukprot:312151-Karenia_brevis.AAC.1
MPTPSAPPKTEKKMKLAVCGPRIGIGNATGISVSTRITGNRRQCIRLNFEETQESGRKTMSGIA